MDKQFNLSQEALSKCKKKLPWSTQAKLKKMDRCHATVLKENIKR